MSHLEDNSKRGIIHWVCNEDTVFSEKGVKNRILHCYVNIILQDGSYSIQRLRDRYRSSPKSFSPIN